MITLFQHQQQALDETEGKNRVAYYLDMGLGKTFVGSEKMMKLNKRINLVVCQCSKVQDWIEHFQDHYTRNCVFDLTNPKTFKWFFEQVQHEVPTLMIGVINYELTFRRNVLKTLTGFTLMLDESSLIQNENAKRSKFILGLKPDNVILLSGTPTGGKYENLWSQCQLLGWKISKELFWNQYIQTEWVETDGFWRQQITGYKNVDRLKMKLAEHGAVFMTTEQAGISLPKRNWIKVKTRPSPLYWKFWNDRYIAIDSANLGEFELDADFYGSNAHCKRELIGDTSLTRRLYARQLCGLYNPARYEAFRDLVNSTEDRLIVFYNFTEEMKRLKGIAKGLNRPVSVLSGEEKNLDAYRYQHNSITFIQYQAGAMGGNFQLANKIIYFSLPQGSELWEQSQKRIHRLGQERPCFYYLMICPGTVEEDILSTLEMRKDYTDELFRKYEQAATAPQSP
jgi:SNF2 family DNA or RNA helicase